MEPSGERDRRPEVVYVETDVGRMARAAVRGGTVGGLIGLALFVAGIVTLGACALLFWWAFATSGMYDHSTPTPLPAGGGALAPALWWAWWPVARYGR